MSKSMNMLRTRRRDNNVKPNRRLDRKSSRGMIYENEELRLKTININAEIERGQSDIKKLKRENEMLKKEIWCLRDEYEKLDKLLKDKDIDFSSCSTTCTSDTDSCSSCSEDSDQVETSQNLENVQKTNLKNLHVEFDHLSVVPEENSTENSEMNSNRTSMPNDIWNLEKNIIKPDQSYPSFEALSKASTLPVQDKTPKHFFSPIKASKSCEDCLNNEFLPPCSSQNLYDVQNQQYLHRGNEYSQQIYAPMLNVCTTKSYPIYENYPRNVGLQAMIPLSKSSTDLIVKMDNHNFNTLTSSSFSNGGNLEELLNDIESISQDILKLSNPNLHYNGDTQQRFGHEREPPMVDIQGPKENFEVIGDNLEASQQNKPYKSEISVVLMPTPMPLIGFEKYRNIQLSCESVHTKSLENLKPVTNELPKTPEIVFTPENSLHVPQPFVSSTTPLPYVPTPTTPLPYIPSTTPLVTPISTNENPFFFGNFKDSGASDFFNSRYNPENYLNKGIDEHKSDKNKKPEVSDSKTNLLEVNSEQVSSENEENLKFKTSKTSDKEDDKSHKAEKGQDKKSDVKSPKMSIRRKVSIHFKGKKDKNVKNKSLDNLDENPPAEKKHSLFDIKFTTETKQKNNLQKTPSMDSKSNLDTSAENKTSSSADSKSEKRNSVADPKTPCPEFKTIDGKAERMTNFDRKSPDQKNLDKKSRKSSSVSPDRKHVHVKEEGKKQHKKHKKTDKLRNRRSTISNDRFHRERSFSVCTDRSNILGMGLNSAFSMYDDYGTSDRERTNSLSSCGTIKMRKMSNISNLPVSGKIPWCGCWGNGCL